MTQDEKRAPREFDIDLGSYRDGIYQAGNHIPEDPYWENCHAIEKSAYDELRTELAEAKREDERNVARIHRQSQTIFDLERERDTAVQAMNDAHYSLRKSGEIDRDLRALADELAGALERFVKKNPAIKKDYAIEALEKYRAFKSKGEEQGREEGDKS